MDDKSIDIEKIFKLLSEKADIEHVLGGVDWKGFELFCKTVLEENGFKTRFDFRFKEERRYQIDIIAIKGDRCLAIDCKHWGIRPGKKSALRKAADKQKERVGALRMNERFWEAKKTYPLIITLLEEDILKEDGVYVVPISKLNSFLVEIDRYL